jgi:hypothetical protein
MAMHTKASTGRDKISQFKHHLIIWAYPLIAGRFDGGPN